MQSSTASDEKAGDKEAQIKHEEHAIAATEEQSSILAHRDKKFEARTIRKVDVRLLIILGALYAISLIDRGNLGVARVAGMDEGLQLSVGERYSIVSVVFLVAYIVFELPSNLLMRAIGARLLIIGISVAFGVITLCMGFVNTWGQLAACRFLLGIFEAGFFPGAVYLITCWYTRYRMQKRLGAFYLTSNALSGFSGILAYGCSQLEGVGGLAGWRWIFVLQGIITLVLAAIGALVLVDFPDRATFLSPEEKALMLALIEEDRGDSERDVLNARVVLHHLKDWKPYLWGLMFLCCLLPSYSITYFLPIILSSYGYSRTATLLLVAPVQFVASVFGFIMAVISDRYRSRGIIIVCNSTLSAIGLCLLLFMNSNRSLQYFGAFLVNMGATANIPAVVTYQSNNVVEQSKRGVASAVQVSVGGIGGIMASTVFRQRDYPRYIPGLSSALGAQGLMISLVIFFTLFFRHQNRQVTSGRKVLNSRPGWLYTM